MKKSRRLLFLLILILTTLNFTPLKIVKSTPYQIYNYGVGVSPLPAEVGMNISIIGGYTLKYTPQIEEGYAIFRLRNTTQIIFEKVYTEPADYIERIVNFTLSPESWAPGRSGALGIAQLDLVIKTGGEIFTDNSTVYFYVQRASPSCELKNLKIIEGGYIKATLELYNSYNSDYKVSGILVNTQITVNSQIIAENISLTDLNGLFNIYFKHVEGVEKYNIRVITGESEQYQPGLFNFTISVNYTPESERSENNPYLLLTILACALIIAVACYAAVKKTKRKPDLIID